MINLLSAEKKEALFLEQVKKMALVLSGAVVVGLLCLFLVLLSIKFYILSELVLQQSILDGLKSPKLEQARTTVQKSNAIVSQVSSFYEKRFVFGPAFEKFTTIQMPPGVRVSSVVLDKGQDGATKVAISGTSSTREDLLKLKEIIELDKSIKNSQFSPESWTKDKDAKFSLDFETENGN